MNSFDDPGTELGDISAHHTVTKNFTNNNNTAFFNSIYKKNATPRRTDLIKHRDLNKSEMPYIQPGRNSTMDIYNASLRPDGNPSVTHNSQFMTTQDKYS